MAFNAEAKNDPVLSNAMMTLKVHANENNPKARPVDPKDASPEVLAELTVQRVLSKLLVGPAAKAAVETAYKRLDPDPSGPVGAQQALPIGRLAFAVALVGEADFASDMAQRALSGNSPQGRAWANLVNAHIALEAAFPAMSSERCWLTKVEVKGLCNVLDDLESCLAAFQMASDVGGIHATCRCGAFTAGC
jgi:hypothetical protein